MVKIRVGVIRGGRKERFNDSIDSGQSVIEALSQEPERYRVRDILVDTNGQWHASGIPCSALRATRNDDVFFNATGSSERQVHTMLGHHRLASTGSRGWGSSISANRLLARKTLRQIGVPTPRFVSFGRHEHRSQVSREVIAYDQLHRVCEELSGPWIVRSVEIGAETVAHEERELHWLLREYAASGEDIFVEALIEGTTFTSQVLDTPRGAKVLPPRQVDENNDRASELRSASEVLPEIATRIRDGLGLRHYFSITGVVDEAGRVFVLDFDPHPSVSEGSRFRQGLEEAGISFSTFLGWLLQSALAEARGSRQPPELEQTQM